MKAEERTVSRILTEQICYQIPPYQRPYSWERENAQQLLADMWDAYEGQDGEYFIGSLITIEREPNVRYDVVDGQQRLTTLNVILARLRDHIENDAAKAELGKRILPRNVLTGDAETPRLVLRQRDQAFFRRYILEGAPLPSADIESFESPQRHLAENAAVVDAFCIAKSQHVLKLFANYVLTKVYVVFVTTDSLQSAYRLFNVLNARGMSLSNADLIKNSLFSQLGTSENRSAELEGRWLELEEEVGIERLDTFWSHHRTSVVAAKARGSLHEEVEPLIVEGDAGPFAFLDSVVASAGNYMRIVEAETGEATTLRAVRALQRVEYDEWIPPLLAFLNNPTRDMKESDFAVLLEKITMQNWVRRLGRTARLTVYYQLINAIRAEAPAADVRQVFVNSARNEEFLDLLGRELYGRPFDSAVLLRLEEAGQDESVTRTYGGRITIEHVLPQALKDPYWQERFTPEEHGVWLHRLGNLTLLSGHKNYRAQYYDFERKKRIYLERNQRVSFDLTKQVCEESEWTVDLVKRRHQMLIERARETWAIA
jgi:hypothetical protein